MCIECAKKEIPVGPPLKRLRRYGFKVSYRMRQEMRLNAEIFGSIPTECEPEDESICMSHLFVACDGETYRGYAWITQGGSSLSGSEAYHTRKD